MRWYTVDYLARESNRRSGVIDRGFWLDGVPRLMPLCRIVGHRPVVDGVQWEPDATTRPREDSLWVACRRCGLRPEPQGRLDPDQWTIGQTYDGPVAVSDKTPRPMTRAYCQPGPWPVSPRGSLGGQLVIGRGFGVFGAEVKVGNQSSEQALAVAITLGNLASLYLHSEQHGQWLQRCLNPRGFDSRVIKIAISNGQLRWRLWAKRNHDRDNGVAAWRHANITIDPRRLLFGPLRHTVTDVADPVRAIVRMPHGDDYLVEMRLQKLVIGRTRGRQTESWLVEWESKAGIPVKAHPPSRLAASFVDVTAQAVQRDAWATEAAAAIATQLTRDRIRNGYADLAMS